MIIPLQSTNRRYLLKKKGLIDTFCPFRSLITPASKKF